ncbi:diguanylate cyclase [Oxalobacteraceae bacterium OM1]|nr:diguanylate cyclase [Oxalobacteraceae bacterium OM1]
MWASRWWRARVPEAVNRHREEARILAELDPRSLIFVSGLLGLMCSAILFMLRGSFPLSIGGLRNWAWGLLCMVIASGMYGLTGSVPSFFPNVGGNVLLVGGIMLVYAGFVRFLKRRPRVRLLAVTLAAVFAFCAWFTYVRPSYPLRALLVTSVDTCLFLACAALILKTSAGSFSGRFTGLVFVAIGTISAARVAMLLLQLDTPDSVMGPTPGQKFYLVAIAFAILAITLGAIMMANERLRAELEFIASHDQLTGAYARGAFIEQLQTELCRSERSGRPPALLMFDLDHFKTVNDRFGHAVGDKVITDFVRRTRELLRGHDMLGRYGGEEFVALLPETTREEACKVAERICHGIAVHVSMELPRYTVSIGVAGAEAADATVDALLFAADRALYAAKADGRNCVRGDPGQAATPRETASG